MFIDFMLNLINYYTTKLMDYNKIYIVIFIVFFTISCDNENYYDIEIIRFEKKFYNSDENELDNLILKYPFLFPSQFLNQYGLIKSMIQLKMIFIIIL
jgi:hypothetical protein